MTIATAATTLKALRELERAAEVCFVITFVSLALRLWTRAKILGHVQFDDWAVIASWLCFVASVGLSIQVVRRVDDLFAGKTINIDQLMNMVKAGTTVYIAAMALLKISLGAFFFRIFSMQRMQRHIIYTVVTITVIYSIVCGAVTAATCGATAGFIGASSSCNISRAFDGITDSWSVLNAVGDVVFSALSVDALRRAQMSRSTRFYAALVLVLGTIGGIASIIRLTIITRAADSDGDLEGITSGTWTILECSIGLTATNLACLRPLLRMIRQKIRSKKEATYSTGESVHPNTVGNHYIKNSPRRLQDLYMLSSTLDTRTDFLSVRDWTEDPTLAEKQINSSDDMVGQVLTVQLPMSVSSTSSEQGSPPTPPNRLSRVLSRESVARLSRIGSVFRLSGIPTE